MAATEQPTRTVLVHLNVEVPDDLLTRVMTAQEIADGLIMPSLEVGMEGSPFVTSLDEGKRWNVAVALAEEI